MPFLAAQRYFVQECDATGDALESADGNINNFIDLSASRCRNQSDQNCPMVLVNI